MYSNYQDYYSSILSCSKENFEALALAVFQFQAQHNPVFRKYIQLLNISVAAIRRIDQIPFLPISTYKFHKVLLDDLQEQKIFESSGTTGVQSARHFISDLSFYESVATQGFQAMYGPLHHWNILALLPGYLERKNSSLVYMVQHFMNQTNRTTGFFLDDYKSLAHILTTLEKENNPTLLIGVTHALVDFAHQYPMPLHNTVLMETGGMKGRKREWTRTELHEYFQQQFGLPNIHAEYGMTELISQAYSKGAGLFQPINTMKVLVRDMNDPLATLKHGNGALNIIDLANIHSCCFIATEDMGNLYEDGSFTVNGRLDHSALRGCSLMVP